MNRLVKASVTSGWRNRQTRTFEGRMVIRVGSSPILHTKNTISWLIFKGFYKI